MQTLRQRSHGRSNAHRRFGDGALDLVSLVSGGGFPIVRRQLTKGHRDGGDMGRPPVRTETLALAPFVYSANMALILSFLELASVVATNQSRKWLTG